MIAAQTDTAREFLARVEPLVRELANKLARKCSPFGTVDADDLYQEGMVEAWRLAGSFDPSAASPDRFAYHRVRGAMLDHVRRLGPLTRYEWRRRRALDPEFAVNSGLAEYVEPAAHAFEPADEPAAELLAALRRVGVGLARGDREIILLRYVGDMTLKEIGARRGLSESRLSQCHARLIDKLRTRILAAGRTARSAFA